MIDAVDCPEAVSGMAQQLRITPNEDLAGGECTISALPEDRLPTRVYRDSGCSILLNEVIVADARGYFGPIFLTDGDYLVTIVASNGHIMYHERVSVPFVPVDVEH
jgi:hypothetical protein